jgi:hypothetical protein
MTSLIGSRVPPPVMAWPAGGFEFGQGGGDDDGGGQTIVLAECAAGQYRA